MTVLTPSPNPATILTRSSTRNILQLLAPAFDNSVYLATVFQKLISTTTLFLLFRAHFLSLIILQQSYYLSSILLIQSYYASSIAARTGYWGVKKSVGLSWKALEPLRNKLFKEFMIFVLGGGNGLILVIFWPGWIVVGPAALGVWFMCD